MKRKEYLLRSKTDIKVFLLYILDRIGYPIDYSTLTKIIGENAPALTIDYEECIAALTDDGHVCTDTLDGERYYMISDSGRKIAAELYDTLDSGLREKSERCAAKYLSLSSRDAKLGCEIRESGKGKYEVAMTITDPEGLLLSVTIGVKSLAEANSVRANFEAKPEGVYRSVLYGLTGKVEYIP